MRLLIHGVVLLKAPAGVQERLLSESRKIKGVVDAFSVFGRYDAVVLIEAENFDGLRKVAEQVNAIRGIRSTETLPEAE